MCLPRMFPHSKLHQKEKNTPIFSLRSQILLACQLKTLLNEAATSERMEMKQEVPSLLSMALKD